MLDRMQVQPTQEQPPAPLQLQNYESRQFYLEAAPAGVDARYAWTLPGGTGKGVRVVDVETGWDVGHFEFAPTFFTNGNNAHVDHGTAVWGEIAARRDDIGVTGIAYDVEYGLAGNGWEKGGGFNDYPNTMASVIEGAVAAMSAGDVLVIEQHAPLVGDYGPIEYFEPVFRILKTATDNGIHCVAAAGNGYSNLDDPKYKGAFDLNVRDSGCILVGAALPPQRTDAHVRADFSNYGSRVDAFGYGEDVVTTGYGDLFDGHYQGKNASFTSVFSGTSSATPIVSGAVISVLGIAKAKGVAISPKDLREALRATGTEQKGANKEVQHIGNLPDIKQLVERFQLQ
jgi:subtilisin family serine protease